MKVDRIEIHGFWRLLEASAYVGRKTVALVGPNEAGKTSVLDALQLFNTEAALLVGDTSRALLGTERDPADDVAVIWIELDESQRALLARLPLRAQPEHVLYHKQAGGEVVASLHPWPIPSKKIRDAARDSWFGLLPALEKHDPGIDDVEQRAARLNEIDQLSTYFKSGGGLSTRLWQSRMAELRALPVASAAHSRRLADMEEFDSWCAPGADPLDLALEAIGSPDRPRFVLFGEKDRALLPRYSISDPNSDQDVALRNLMQLAGLDLGALRAAASIPAYMLEITERANERLREYFTTVWSQEKVTVGFQTDGDTLLVNVKDLSEGSVGWLSIVERSDGLRTFVALVAFLQAHSDDSSPVLLIDEAELHLHLNAQADLVGLLQGLKNVSQVIYTTHSPGCLPGDLGNGVRFVRPLADGTSEIRHDFWSLHDAGHVGFNPLLFVMGAGAAAFSSLRYALVVEGPGDMLLLPTLLRLATGLDELPYQVAPGIAAASRAEMADFDYVASRVAFMVDGDDGGRKWREHLLEVGVPEERIRFLGRNVAAEDLLTRAYYFEVLGWFGFNASDLSLTSGPVKSRITQATRGAAVKPPGPTVVAENILGRLEDGRTEIKLSAAGRRRLLELHSWTLDALGL